MPIVEQAFGVQHLRRLLDAELDSIGFVPDPLSKPQVDHSIAEISRMDSFSFFYNSEGG